jgi:hypothetical protein
MECFERLVMTHINTIILENLDPLQFVNRPNRSTDDAISIALHTAMLILNTGDTQGCVLSQLLYSLFTQDCLAKHDSNTIIKFADDTTVVGLITDNDDTAYTEEVRDLAVWCQDSNLPLLKRAREHIFPLRRLKRFVMGP